ncbi:MAG: 4-fold beta flower protein [Promethearchaeota archaeon]
MSLIFYNKTGTPIAYSDNKVNVFYFTGKAIAYIHQDSIYSYEGKHLGFFKDGWIRDNQGKCVLFTLNAKNGPKKRIKDISPVKSQKSDIPDMKSRENIKIRLIEKQEWSELISKEFFKQ